MERQILSTTRNYPTSHISRRSFLKLAAAGLGGLALPGLRRFYRLPEFPEGERLGRICRPFSKVDVKAKPDYESQTVKVLYDDTVVPWVHEVVGRHFGRNNQRYVETPEGYVWSADIQPVRNLPNQPLQQLPGHSNGAGMWAEVTVPWVDIVLERDPAAPWLKGRKDLGAPMRLYYSQVIWIDQIKTDETDQVWYRVNERYGSYGDIYWAAAEAFRPIEPDEITPISPEVEEKRVVVNVDWKRQTLSCYEGNSEVYFCTISSGVEQGSTPPGEHTIWRKLYSVHMSGGTTGGGYDLAGIGWTTLFVGDGVAIHSTFWHNNFGEPESHGCVNARPEDARWIFRWTLPPVAYEPGDLTISGKGSSKVKGVEG
jgi:lipoprotein-anchoring transpeptidase ErfK/SrfK